MKYYLTVVKNDHYKKGLHLRQRKEAVTAARAEGGNQQEEEEA